MATTRTRTGKTPAMVPLSEWKADPTQLPRHYDDGPGRQRRIAGDEHLLMLLSKERAVRQRYGQPWLTVGELPEERLHKVVSEVEEHHQGSWSLDGDDQESIAARLDAHFRPLQAARAEADRERHEEVARRLKAQRAQPQGFPFSPAENGRRDAALWGLQ